MHVLDCEQANFFLIGNRINVWNSEFFEEQTRQHYQYSHTYTHPSIPTITAEQMYYELQNTTEV